MAHIDDVEDPVIRDSLMKRYSFFIGPSFFTLQFALGGGYYGVFNGKNDFKDYGYMDPSVEGCFGRFCMDLHWTRTYSETVEETRWKGTMINLGLGYRAFSTERTETSFFAGPVLNIASMVDDSEDHSKDVEKSYDGVGVSAGAMLDLYLIEQNLESIYSREASLKHYLKSSFNCRMGLRLRAGINYYVTGNDYIKGFSPFASAALVFQNYGVRQTDHRGRVLK